MVEICQFLGFCAIFRAPLEVSRDLCLRMFPFVLHYWRLIQKKKEDIFVQFVPVLPHLIHQYMI